MDEPTSKLEQLLIQLAEWRVRFVHERQWRESVEKDKKALEEKYSQVVFELGTQKRAIEDLEARVALLTATTEPRTEEHAGASGTGEAEKGSVRNDSDGKDTKQGEGIGQSGHEPVPGGEKSHTQSGPDDPRQDTHQDTHKRTHYIYSNPVIYESSVAWARSRFHSGHSKAQHHGAEEEPYIFHRYRPDEDARPDIPKKHAAEELNTVLDEEIASLEKGLTETGD